MSENILSFGGSQQFRKKLVSRNLKPYKIDGAFSSNQEPINSETVLNDSSPVDTPNVSNTIFVEPTEMTVINIFGPSGNFIDGADGFCITISIFFFLSVLFLTYYFDLNLFSKFISILILPLIYMIA